MGGAKAVIRAGRRSARRSCGATAKRSGRWSSPCAFSPGPTSVRPKTTSRRCAGPARPAYCQQRIDGVPFEDVLTGFGVVVAAEVALGSLDGATVAIEGFGKVGGGVAREAVRRGAKVVAVSTLEGCAVEPKGFDVSELWAKRTEHGDRVVRHVGGEVRAPSALFDIAADVVVPGARTGVIDADSRAANRRSRRGPGGERPLRRRHAGDPPRPRHPRASRLRVQCRSGDRLHLEYGDVASGHARARGATDRRDPAPRDRASARAVRGRMRRRGGVLASLAAGCRHAAAPAVGLAIDPRAPAGATLTARRDAR